MSKRNSGDESMSEQVKVAVDAMGGDYAPAEPVLSLIHI